MTTLPLIQWDIIDISFVFIAACV